MTLPPLPPPDTHCWDEDTSKDVWSHSDDAMRAYAEQAVAAERKDAERYRWLSNQATQQADAIGPIFRMDVRRRSNDATLFSLSAAIDAAMQASEHPHSTVVRQSYTIPLYAAPQQRKPLTDEQIDAVHEQAFRELVATGWNGGMCGEQWDHAAARAIERAITGEPT